jgi:hypothetical protein
VVESNQKYTAKIEEQLSHLSLAIFAVVTHLRTLSKLKVQNEEMQVLGPKKVTRVVSNKLLTSLVLVQSPTGSTSSASTPVQNSAVAAPTVEIYMAIL